MSKLSLGRNYYETTDENYIANYGDILDIDPPMAHMPWEILAAMEDAKARGEGATVYKGRLVDIASIKQAEVIVRQSEMIAAS